MDRGPNTSEDNPATLPPQTDPKPDTNVPVNHDDSNILSQGERQKLRTAQPETKRPASYSVMPGVRKCSWESFVNRFSETEQVWAIDVLVAGDRLGKDMLEEAGKRKSSGYFQAADYEMQGRVNRISTNSTWIQRVRIQSRNLLDTFSRITGYAWGPPPYTFMRPFQYLHHFHDKFEEELQRLEEKQRQRFPPVIDTQTMPSNPQDKDTNTLFYLRAYMKFANEELRPDYERFHSQTGSTRIRFNDLWYLFRTGELIYVPEKTLKRFVKEKVDSKVQWSFDSSHQSSMRQKIWRLHEVTIPYADPGTLIENDEERSPFRAYVYYLDYDGSSYSPDIRDLELYPFRYTPKADELLEEHKKLGTMLTNCISTRHMSYNGWTLITGPTGSPITSSAGPFGEQQIRPQHIDGEVIVDFRAAFNFNPRLMNDFEESDLWESMDNLSQTVNGPDLLTVWSDRQRSRIISVSREIIVSGDDVEEAQRNNFLTRDKYLGLHKDPNHIPDGDDLALLPRRAFVYSLTEGSFEAVDVRYMKTIEFGNDSFSRLQLPESHKRMIYSAVQSHLKRRRIERTIEKGLKGQIASQDFIRGKGRGLILMLHGEPGIGKTATAEAVAQTFKRPLFPISCGNLNGVWAAERRLEEVFRLADMWDCILLLDEADVFLSARTPTDSLERNSLVSIFLRKLEYYNGILFLTTNRIGKIDQAISSRIHLILHYKRLGRAEIEGIFRINIDCLRKMEQQQSENGGGKPLVPVESDILQFAADHCRNHPKGRGVWNGRQIRNAFIIAASLARDEAEKQPPDFQPQLRYWHFKQVEKLMAEYVRFRAHILGKDDSQQALLNEERDDDYEDTRIEEERVHTDFARQGLMPEQTAGIISFATAYPQRHRIHDEQGPFYGHHSASVRQTGSAGVASPSAYGYGLSHQSSLLPQPATTWLGTNGTPEIHISGLERGSTKSTECDYDSRSDTCSKD